MPVANGRVAQPLRKEAAWVAASPVVPVAASEQSNGTPSNND
jgi:hypothetical protein